MQRPTITPEIQKWIDYVAAKGGAAGKNNPKRSELNKRAAIARWQKEHPKPKKVVEEKIID